MLAAVLAMALLASPVIALAPSTPEGGDGPRASSAPSKKRTVERSRLLWATVNVCDTARSPNTIGVRGSMPGAADGRERMFMRFRVQYFSPRDGAWHRIRKGADSGFVRVGLARYESRQSGRSFRIVPRGESILLRGVVTFEWRTRSGEVVRRATKRTTGKRRSSAGADPRRYSASNCRIKR